MTVKAIDTMPTPPLPLPSAPKASAVVSVITLPMTGGADTVPTSVARSWLSLVTTMEDGPSSTLSLFHPVGDHPVRSFADAVAGADREGLVDVVGVQEVYDRRPPLALRLCRRIGVGGSDLRRSASGRVADRVVVAHQSWMASL
jgi:hypothetical protein